MFKAGFIGCGNMGGALATAVSKAIDPAEISLSDFISEKARELAEKIRAVPSDNENIAKNCKYIFLGVKPQVMEKTAQEISPFLKKRTDRFIIVSMAAGLSIAAIQKMLGSDYPVIRIMPNTPVSVGKGVVLYSESEKVSVSEEEEFEALLKCAGIVDQIPESMIDAASAVSGCGPAFVYLFIEALADGGVLCGLPRDKAMAYAANTVMGAAETVIKSGKHPGVLKDAVCSPGGTTIEGVKALEDGSFRGAAMDAVIKAYEKTLRLKK